MSHRPARVARDLRERLARILTEKIRDPRLQGVTLLDLKVSPDFSFARVFYRVMGDAEEAAQALDKAKPYIRRRLGQGLKLRRVPELDFRLDRTVEQAERIEEILDEIGDDPGIGEEPG